MKLINLLVFILSFSVCINAYANVNVTNESIANIVVKSPYIDLKYTAYSYEIPATQLQSTLTKIFNNKQNIKFINGIAITNLVNSTEVDNLNKVLRNKFSQIGYEQYMCQCFLNMPCGGGFIQEKGDSNNKYAVGTKIRGMLFESGQKLDIKYSHTALIDLHNSIKQTSLIQLSSDIKLPTKDKYYIVISTVNNNGISYGQIMLFELVNFSR